MSESQLVVCPVCASINRVPAAKIGAAPNCGRCSMPLFQRQPTDVDATAFDRHVVMPERLQNVGDRIEFGIGECRHLPAFFCLSGRVRWNQQASPAASSAES